MTVCLTVSCRLSCLASLSSSSLSSCPPPLLLVLCSRDGDRAREAASLLPSLYQESCREKRVLLFNSQPWLDWTTGGEWEAASTSRRRVLWRSDCFSALLSASMSLPQSLIQEEGQSWTDSKVCIDASMEGKKQKLLPKTWTWQIGFCFDTFSLYDFKWLTLFFTTKLNWVTIPFKRQWSLQTVTQCNVKRPP